LKLLQKMKIRVGLGFDVHQLRQGRKFILGGVDIPHEKGIFGHSDADVLVHAIMDALLGAAGLRDIGYYFPDTQEDLKGISSMLLLAKVSELIKEHGFSIGNIDCTIILQKPKVAPHVEQMKENICKVLGLEHGDLSLKATTNEKMGYIGEEQGIEAFAVALLYKDSGL